VPPQDAKVMIPSQANLRDAEGSRDKPPLRENRDRFFDYGKQFFTYFTPGSLISQVSPSNPINAGA